MFGLGSYRLISVYSVRKRITFKSYSNKFRVTLYLSIHITVFYTHLQEILDLTLMQCMVTKTSLSWGVVSSGPASWRLICHFHDTIYLFNHGNKLSNGLKREFGYSTPPSGRSLFNVSHTNMSASMLLAAPINQSLFFTIISLSSFLLNRIVKLIYALNPVTLVPFPLFLILNIYYN